MKNLKKDLKEGKYSIFNGVGVTPLVKMDNVGFIYQYIISQKRGNTFGNVKSYIIQFDTNQNNLFVGPF